MYRKSHSRFLGDFALLQSALPSLFFWGKNLQWHLRDLESNVDVGAEASRGPSGKDRRYDDNDHGSAGVSPCTFIYVGMRTDNPRVIRRDWRARTLLSRRYWQATPKPRSVQGRKRFISLTLICQGLMRFSTLTLDLKALVSNLSPRYCFQLLSQPSVYSLRQLERINFRSWIDFKNDF